MRSAKAAPLAGGSKAKAGTDRHAPDRSLAVLPRLRLHRRRRSEARLAGVARAHRARRPDSRRRAPRSARARARCTRRSSPTRWACRTTASTSTPPTPAQCPTAGRPWRRAPAWSSAASCSAAPRRCAQRLGAAHAARVSADSTARSSSPRSTSGRGEMSWDDDSYQGDAYGSYGWGCDVVELEVDLDTWEARPIAFTHRARDRQGDPSGARGGPDRRRQRAGARLGAARRRGDARRPDGERTAHQLHHPDDARHAADRGRDPRESLQARSVRRQGRRRDADRRPGAGGHQRAATRGLRSPRDSRDARTDDGRVDCEVSKDTKERRTAGFRS